MATGVGNRIGKGRSSGSGHRPKRQIPSKPSLNVAAVASGASQKAKPKSRHKALCFNTLVILMLAPFLLCLSPQFISVEHFMAGPDPPRSHLGAQSFNAA